MTTNLNEAYVENKISIFPNPFNFMINIDIAVPNSLVTIFSVKGKVIHTVEISNNSTSIYLPNFQR